MIVSMIEGCRKDGVIFFLKSPAFAAAFYFEAVVYSRCFLKIAAHACVCADRYKTKTYFAMVAVALRRIKECLRATLIVMVAVADGSSVSIIKGKESFRKTACKRSRVLMHHIFQRKVYL